MKRVVSDERVARFVSAETGVAFVPPYTCLGVERDGKIIGGVLFNCFEGSDVHASVAGDKHAWSRGVLADVGAYLFDVLKVERVTALTEQPGVIRIALKLGGRIEGTVRNHFGKGRDATMIGILRDEWSF